MEFKFNPVPANPDNPPFHNFLPEAPSVSDQESSSSSDCSSTVCSSSSSHARRRSLFPESLAVELTEGQTIYELIRRRFTSGLGPLGEKTTVVAIHRRNWFGISDQARVQSFKIHSKAVENKNGVSPNVKFAWFGHGRDRILEIFKRGFSCKEVDNIHGAVFLSPDFAPAESVERAVPDEDGVRHVLLCRVIVGRPELVALGSAQTHPSSDEFDSGVDCSHNPKKYIIWSTDMNTHILPEYVVSFRAPESSSLLRGSTSTIMGNGMRRPRSPWVSFPALIAVLAKFLPPDAVQQICEHFKELKEKKITRLELIRKVREIAGDKLLIAVIKSCTAARNRKVMNI